MKQNNKKKPVPHIAPKMPKFSQRQFRAMERKRNPRETTPLLTRIKRQQIMKDFFERIKFVEKPRERKPNRRVEK